MEALLGTAWFCGGRPRGSRFLLPSAAPGRYDLESRIKERSVLQRASCPKAAMIDLPFLCGIPLLADSTINPRRRSHEIHPN
jgi:hypothetical protein